MCMKRAGTSCLIVLKKNPYIKHSIKTPSTFLSHPSYTSYVSTLSMPHNSPFISVFAKSCFSSSSSSVSDLPLKNSSGKTGSKVILKNMN